MYNNRGEGIAVGAQLSNIRITLYYSWRQMLSTINPYDNSVERIRFSGVGSHYGSTVSGNMKFFAGIC